MPTTGYIIVSGIMAAVTWVILYGLYIIFTFPFVSVQNQVVQLFGVSIPQLGPMAANLTSGYNAAFVIIAVGEFFFLLIVPSIREPTSTGFE